MANWLEISAFIGVVLSFVIGISAAMIAQNYRKDIPEILQEIIKSQGYMENTEMPIERYYELQRIITRNNLPLDIHFHPLSKDTVMVGIKPIDSTVTNGDMALFSIESIRYTELLKRRLFWVNISTIFSIAAIFFGVISIFGMFRPLTAIDLLSISIAPIALAATFGISFYIRKVRYRKVSGFKPHGNN